MTKNDQIMKKLREVEMEITDEFARICEKHNLEYFLCGGTMLGAIRHKGFIPWDDDMDVGMPRKDYDKFLEIAKNELDKKFFLDCYDTNKDYYLPFAKIRKNNTIFDEVESHEINKHKGIFIDIIPFDNAAKESSVMQKVQGAIVRTITDTIFCKQKLKKFKDARHPIISGILNIFSKKSLVKFQKKMMCLNKNDNSEYMVALSGRYNVTKETNKRDVFVPSKKIKFENREYKGMNKPKIYLSKIYGDYMKLPPEDKRVTHMPLKIEFDTRKK